MKSKIAGRPRTMDVPKRIGVYVAISPAELKNLDSLLRPAQTRPDKFRELLMEAASAAR